METYSVASQEGSVKPLPGAAVDTLRQRLRGRLFTREEEGYEAARQVWNGMIDKKPVLIVQCLGVADVITTVNFAREHRILASVRGGGHNVAGAAVADQGLVIDLSAMRSVQVDPERRVARAEGGARLGDLDHETQAFGLAAPVGVVSATGVAGLTLHGGAGWLLRKHGLAIDNLLTVDIVTADGRLRKASPTENPNLFWALRGGGGNFGVVTALEYRLHPVGPEVWMAVPMYPLERAEQVLGGLRDYLATAPEDLMALGVFWSAPKVPEVPAAWHGAPVVILLGCYTGPVEEGERMIAPLRQLGEPIADLSARMPWCQAQQFLDADYPDGACYYWKSLYFERLDDEVIRTLAQQTRARPSPESSLDVWLLGGAASWVKPTDTAFYRREAPFLLGIEANWHQRGEADANLQWARTVFDEMQRFSGGGVYLNFPGFLEERDTLLQAAYGPNLERLRAIKAQYDPTNLFPGLLSLKPPPENLPPGTKGSKTM